MAPVEIYTQRYCPYCNWAKELLTRKGVSFNEIDVTADRQMRQHMIERANVQGACRVPEQCKAAIAGRRLVVLDDVLTSGATVEGCARALLRAGARHVDVLVFARVADPVRISI